LLLSAAGLSASDDGFYQRLYQRGMTHFAAADYAVAFTELRSAAFGFLEKVEQFEIAQSYACVAAHRLGRDNDARDSLMRIISAENLQPRYRAIKLRDDVRAEVNAVAATVLTADEAAILGVTVAAKPVVNVPAPSKRPNVAVPAPRDGGSPDNAVPLLPRHIPPILPAIVLTALHDANADSDAPRFEGALAVAKFVAEAMPIGPQRNEFRRCILIYQDIGAVLTYAMRDPSGAYFNDESLPGMHDRLNANYPGYDHYIAEFRIADAKGNVLYPTAETRTFLVGQLTSQP
jgi:hypothetical protein